MSASGVGRSTLSLGLTQAVVLGLSFVSAIVTARFLGAAGRGLLTMAMVGPALVVSLGHFGIVQSVYYFGANDASHGPALRWATMITVGLGVVYGAAWFVGSQSIA